jgi:hypothetical protein
VAKSNCKVLCFCGGVILSGFRNNAYFVAKKTLEKQYGQKRTLSVTTSPYKQALKMLKTHQKSIKNNQNSENGKAPQGFRDLCGGFISLPS